MIAPVARACALLVALCCGCSVKPIRVVDASEGDASGADDASDASDASDERLAPDALASDATDGAASEAGITIRPSCPDPPNGDRQCALSIIDAPASTICIGVATNPTPSLDVSPQVCDVVIRPFAFDRTEVTVRRFSLFYEAWQRGALPAQYVVRYPNGMQLTLDRPDLASPMQFAPSDPACTWSNGLANARELHPINCVSFDVAQFFCAWDGGRLPTRAEFEYVARYWGGAPAAGRLTPWGGGTLTCEHAHLAGCAGANGLRTRHAADGAIGAANGEVFNLVGNVAEWVIDRFESYATLPNERCWIANQLCVAAPTAGRELRGGSYLSPPIFSRAVSRESAIAAPTPDRGFRCAYPVR